MVLVKIEPKEAVCFIKLRQSIPHSGDTVGNEEGSEGGLHVCASLKHTLHYILHSLEEQSKNHMLNNLNRTL